MKMGFNSSSASVKFFCGSLKKYKDMPCKALITVAAAILLVVLIILANRPESSSQGISGASGGTAAGLEMDLPTEEKIPTH